MTYRTITVHAKHPDDPRSRDLQLSENSEADEIYRTAIVHGLRQWGFDVTVTEQKEVPVT